MVTDTVSTPEYQMMFIERQSIGGAERSAGEREEAVGGKVN